MTSRTSWVAGNGAGLTWTQAFNYTDVGSLASGSAVMSSVADIANGTYLDMFADVACELTISSTTLAAGASLALWVFDKYEIDGSTNYYGDNSLLTGSAQKAYFPSYQPLYIASPTITGSGQTVVVATFKQIILPPRSFRFAFGNLLGVTLAQTHQPIDYVTYNINLND
jgi:hypothetical protein